MYHDIIVDCVYCYLAIGNRVFTSVGGYSIKRTPKNNVGPMAISLYLNHSNLYGIPSLVLSSRFVFMKYILGIQLLFICTCLISFGVEHRVDDYVTCIY